MFHLSTIRSSTRAITATSRSRGAISTLFLATSALLLVAGCTGCSSDRAAAPSAAGVQTASASAASSNKAPDESVQADIASLRAATASFHRFETAMDAGWSTKITSCMSDPTAGGMGFHYGNVGLIDGTVRVDAPELLLYEPEQNGRLRLVAVEYIIPYTAHARSAAPPVLFGQSFIRNDVFQLWGLHVWAWKTNPSGMFASWNPNVTCANTADVAAMAH